MKSWMAILKALLFLIICIGGYHLLSLYCEKVIDLSMFIANKYHSRIYGSIVAGAGVLGFTLLIGLVFEAVTKGKKNGKK
jgi:hypothetical protein